MLARDGILRGTRSGYQVLSELGLRIATDPNAISVISVVTSNRDPFHTSEIWTRLPVNRERKERERERNRVRNIGKVRYIVKKNILNS